MHAILWGPYQVDANGEYILDRDGERKPEKRAGTKKDPKEWTPGERKSVEDQARNFDSHARWQAQGVLSQIDNAKRVLEGR